MHDKGDGANSLAPHELTRGQQHCRVSHKSNNRPLATPAEPSVHMHGLRRLASTMHACYTTTFHETPARVNIALPCYQRQKKKKPGKLHVVPIGSQPFPAEITCSTWHGSVACNCCRQKNSNIEINIYKYYIYIYTFVRLLCMRDADIV